MTNHPRLTELKIEVTRSCPLHCLHCSSNAHRGSHEALPTQRLIELVSEFRELGGQKIAITGGEPLLHKGLTSVLKACHSRGIETELYTTGINLIGRRRAVISRHVLGLLAEAGAKAVFSLHGVRPATHDFMTRIEGSFALTLQALEQALGAGVGVEVHFVPTSVNVGEMADLCRLVSSFGVRRLSLLRFVPQGRGEENRRSLELDRAQLREMARQRAQLSHDLPGLDIRMGAPFNVLCSQPPVACMAGSRELVIRSDGRAVPCDAFKQFSFLDPCDNTLELHLAQVWQKSALLDAVRRIRASGADGTCSKCSSFRSCQSGCLAQRAISVRQLMAGVDPVCQMNHDEGVRDELQGIRIR